MNDANIIQAQQNNISKKILPLVSIAGPSAVLFLAHQL